MIKVEESQRNGPKVCFVSTTGGHLAQLEMLANSLRDYRSYVVTVRSSQTYGALGGLAHYEIRQVLRNPANFLVNVLQSLRVYLEERPDAVITTGAGDALPTVFLAAILGSQVVFVESLARVNRPSMFGRMVHRWCDLVLVQWPELLRAYPRGILVSPLFGLSAPQETLPPDPAILILTGTHSRGFEYLLKTVDNDIESRRVTGKVTAQIGHSSYIPRNYRSFQFLPHDELLQYLDGCDIVITHDGSASIGEALARGKPTIVVPRSVERGEVSYRSDKELARHLAELRLVVIAEDPAQLDVALSDIRSRGRRESMQASPAAGSVIKSFLQSQPATHKRPRWSIL